MTPARPPQPLAPEVVERIRGHMMTAWSSPSRGTGRSPEQLAWWRARNATIVSLLAYGGLRPVEDRGSCWADVHRDRTLHVVASKTGRARDIDLVAPLAQDLAQWRLLCGRPPGDGLIFPTLDGDEWRRYDWENWCRRVYRPAAIASGVTGELRRYRLRGSFVSLLLWEGRSLTYVAEQAGIRSRRWDATTRVCCASSSTRRARRRLRRSAPQGRGSVLRQGCDGTEGAGREGGAFGL